MPLARGVWHTLSASCFSTCFWPCHGTLDWKRRSSKNCSTLLGKSSLWGANSFIHFFPGQADKTFGEVKQACSSSRIKNNFSNKLPTDRSNGTPGYFHGKEGWLQTNIRQLSGQLRCQVPLPLCTLDCSLRAVPLHLQNTVLPQKYNHPGDCAQQCTHSAKHNLYWLSRCRAKACILPHTWKQSMRPTYVLTSSHNRWTILTSVDQTPMPAQMLYPCLEHNTNCSHWLGLCSKKDATGRGGGMTECNDRIFWNTSMLSASCLFLIPSIRQELEREVM